MSEMFKQVETSLPANQSFWSKFKAFWLQDAGKIINVELTPKQQKVEKEINDFLYQEVTWEKVRKFLLYEIKIGKKKQETEEKINIK